MAKETPLKKELETLYKKLNKKEYIHPDPIEFIYQYENEWDREIVALLASSLAYGKVNQILVSISKVLEKLDPPLEYLTLSSPSKIKKDFKDFRHRFTSGNEMTLLFVGIQQVLKKYGSLKQCFLNGFSPDHETILPSLSTWIKKLGGPIPTLLPSPEKGSACKRLMLFLRWMVRKDQVDPGCWKGIPPSKLVIPLDTHIHDIGLKLGFTQRKNANLKTALEITEAFRAISPQDPIRYDFSLTRLGIRNDMSKNTILAYSERASARDLRSV